MARVLVIDDDADIRELVRFKLVAAGHEVFGESNGQVGLSRAQEVRPDVLIVDWSLPGLNGVAVCSAIRDDPNLAGTWVIMLTARAQQSDMSAGMAAGADEYVTKPFSPRELAARVATATADRTQSRS